MRKAVKTPLPSGIAPIEWATLGGQTLYTAQLPMRADGTLEPGDIEPQTRQTMENLKEAVMAAGGTMADITQVLIYLPEKSDFPAMNRVYETYFTPPYPNRATVVAELMVPDAKIEIVAYAHIEAGHA